MNEPLAPEERVILEKLLSGDDPVLESIREFSRAWHVSRREWTGVGFFVHLDASDPDGKSSGARWIFGDVHGDAGDALCGLIIFVDKDGRHAMLECYTYGDALPAGEYPGNLRYSLNGPDVRDMKRLREQLNRGS